MKKFFFLVTVFLFLVCAPLSHAQQPWLTDTERAKFETLRVAGSEALFNIDYEGARKNFKGIGLKLGLSAVLQRQAEGSDFVLGGLDAEKTLPNGGSLQMAWARSSGEILGSGNVFTTDANTRHDGDAYQLTLAQPLPFFSEEHAAQTAEDEHDHRAASWAWIASRADKRGGRART